MMVVMVDGADEGDATATDASEPAADAPSSTWGLMWVSPVEQFVSLEVRTGIGRDQRCGVRIDGPQVSRQHATIERSGPLWLLRDLQSKNGSWVNARRVDVAPLQLQDVVRIGDWVGIVSTMPGREVEEGPLFSTLPSGLTLSAPTRTALGDLERIAARNIAVAIFGETGTGKEGIAQAIHHMSGRTGELIAINCATIPEAMAEALLFGHRRGAFTGADGPAEGYIRAAQGGTLFLDEIAELSPGVQSKLLRVMEDRRVTPLGSTGSTVVDFRLIVACQEHLAKLVAQGVFRSDLRARVSGVNLTLPALRERRQEIVRLFSTFVAAELGSVPPLDARLVESLCVYDWPENVRELKQVAALLAAGGGRRWTSADLPERVRAAGSASALENANGLPRDPSTRRLTWLSRHARELSRLRVALEKHDGNLTSAAVEAGIPRYRARRLLAAEAECLGGPRK